MARGDQPGLVGGDDRLGAVAEVQLGQDVGDVGLDRRLAETQVGGQLGVGESARQQTQDVELAGGRRGQIAVQGGGFGIVLCEPLDRPPGDRRGQQRVARTDQFAPPPRPRSPTRIPTTGSCSQCGSPRHRRDSIAVIGVCAGGDRCPRGRRAALVGHAGHGMSGGHRDPGRRPGRPWCCGGRPPAFGGLLIGVAGALPPAGWAARARTAVALRPSKSPWQQRKSYEPVYCRASFERFWRRTSRSVQGLLTLSSNRLLTVDGR